MCGIAVALGGAANGSLIVGMTDALAHRGPDDAGWYVDPAGRARLGHRRLSILDLSSAGHQPMSSVDGRFTIVFNGELYNFRELRRQMPDHVFRSDTDTEVVLAAWIRWGERCLDRFLGMFAFAIWDEHAGEAVLVRDRLGVKPLYVWGGADGSLIAASEIDALHAAGVRRRPDRIAWADYLASGRADWSDRTFWEDVRPQAPGTLLRWRDGKSSSRCWYDLTSAVGDVDDDRSDDEVADEWLALAVESIGLRFRSDVPVGINVSGGLDSSFLLAAVREAQGEDSQVAAYTFVTGDERYDELPWVEELLRRTHHRSVVAPLTADEVPGLAAEVACSQGEPYGGLPTLAYARLFEVARQHGTIVLLDGQGLDEQWAGYDYYRMHGDPSIAPVVQGGSDSATRGDLLLVDAAEMSLPSVLSRGADPVRALQLRDLTLTKLPRALRFNDRVSMRVGCELREPFLDHRLIELALRQPSSRKINSTTGKVFLRQMLAERLPGAAVEAPKRPLQTPQREWLRGPLAGWADNMINAGLAGLGEGLLDPDGVRTAWRWFRSGHGDNSFYIWQWVSLGLFSMMRTQHNGEPGWAS